MTLISFSADLTDIYCRCLILLFSTAATPFNLIYVFNPPFSSSFIYPSSFTSSTVFSSPSHYLSISAGTHPVYENSQKSLQCLLVNSEMRSAMASRLSHLPPLTSPLKKVIQVCVVISYSSHAILYLLCHIFSSLRFTPVAYNLHLLLFFLFLTQLPPRLLCSFLASVNLL